MGECVRERGMVVRVRSLFRQMGGRASGRMLWRLMLFVGVCGLFGSVTVASSQSPAPTNAPNLIQDGGFEREGEGWFACGNVLLVDAESIGAEFVRSGRYAVVIA